MSSVRGWEQEPSPGQQMGKRNGFSVWPGQSNLRNAMVGEQTHLGMPRKL